MTTKKKLSDDQQRAVEELVARRVAKGTGDATLAIQWREDDLLVWARREEDHWRIDVGQSLPYGMLLLDERDLLARVDRSVTEVLERRR